MNCRQPAACHPIEGEHESQRSLSEMRKLTSIHFARWDGKIRISAFQRLHARYFVCTFNALKSRDSAFGINTRKKAIKFSFTWTVNIDCP